MTAKQNINFSILSIKELEFNYKNPVESISDFSLEKNPLEAKIKVNYRWNIEKNLFGVVIDFFYVIKDKKKANKELLKLSFITEFFIENLKDIFTVRSNTDFDINERFESTLIGLAISTGRGILLEKTKGTIFNNFIFPIINPIDLILSKKLKEKKE